MSFGHSRRFFDDVTNYIGFGPEDSALLRGFRPQAEPHFERMSEHFYERIFSHPDAHVVITGGDEQVQRLKRSLVEWMRSGLEGPHDAEYCQKRARIGQIHVRIGLPQRYMVTAMNVMRRDFRQIANDALRVPLGAGEGYLERLHNALDRLCDLELAIMLETYKHDSEDRLRRRERLATIGQLAASIGHDLRNPLSVIQSSLYILRRGMKDDARAIKHIERISSQISECDGIITHLLEMARNQPPRRELISVVILVDQSLASLRVPDEVMIVREGLTDLELWVDATLLKQVLINLLLNAVQARPRESAEHIIEIRAERSGEGGEDVTLIVRDSGPGFERDTMPFVFEPLVTTKVSGTGLGLALVKSVIERHGGQVSANNRPSGGAQVTLFLPQGTKAPPASP